MSVTVRFNDIQNTSGARATCSLVAVGLAVRCAGVLQPLQGWVAVLGYAAETVYRWRLRPLMMAVLQAQLPAAATAAVAAAMAALAPVSRPAAARMVAVLVRMCTAAGLAAAVMGQAVLNGLLACRDARAAPPPRHLGPRCAVPWAGWLPSAAPHPAGHAQARRCRGVAPAPLLAALSDAGSAAPATTVSSAAWQVVAHCVWLLDHR